MSRPSGSSSSDVFVRQWPRDLDEEGEQGRGGDRAGWVMVRSTKPPRFKLLVSRHLVSQLPENRIAMWWRTFSSFFVIDKTRRYHLFHGHFIRALPPSPPLPLSPSCSRLPPGSES